MNNLEEVDALFQKRVKRFDGGEPYEWARYCILEWCLQYEPFGERLAERLSNGYLEVFKECR